LDPEPAPFWRSVVPPGSTAIHELATTIASALDALDDELAVRAATVRAAARRLAADRDAGDEEIMLEVWNLRDACARAVAQEEGLPGAEAGTLAPGGPRLTPDRPPPGGR
jgi:hypothetical protein